MYVYKYEAISEKICLSGSTLNCSSRHKINTHNISSGRSQVNNPDYSVAVTNYVCIMHTNGIKRSQDERERNKLVFIMVKRHLDVATIRSTVISLYLINYSYIFLLRLLSSQISEYCSDSTIIFPA